MAPRLSSLAFVLALSGCAERVLVVDANEGDAGCGPPTVLTFDDAITHPSLVPGHEGEPFTLATRERVRADLLRCGSPPLAVLVHGASLPGIATYAVDAPGFDLTLALADAGFDVVAFDLSGYGRSSFPSELDDPCNLPGAERRLLGLDCAPSYPFTSTTSDSDAADLHAVIEHFTALRGRDRVHLIGGSLGGARALYYVSRHPERIDRLIVLAAGGSGALLSSGPPSEVPTPGMPMSAVTRADLEARFAGGTECAPERVRRDVLSAAFEGSLASDPVGAGWGPGIVRAAVSQLWGASTENIASIMSPTLLLRGTCDGLVPEGSAVALEATLGSPERVRVDVEAAGHGMLLENGADRVHALMIAWLRGDIDGRTRGVLRVAADGARRWD